MILRRRAAGRTLSLGSLGLAGTVALAALLAACGSSAPSPTPTAAPSRAPTPVPTPVVLAAIPDAFPTTWVNKPSNGPLLLSTEPNGLRAHFTGSLVAADGTTATYKATYLDSRVPVGSITCGHGTYRDVFTSTDPALTFTIEVPGWGTGTLSATKRVVVYSSSGNGSSPPVCDDLVGGTYQLSFSGSHATGTLAGSWSVDAKGQIVLEAPTASPAASPAASATKSP